MSNFEEGGAPPPRTLESATVSVHMREWKRGRLCSKRGRPTAKKRASDLWKAICFATAARCPPANTRCSEMPACMQRPMGLSLSANLRLHRKKAAKTDYLLHMRSICGTARGRGLHVRRVLRWQMHGRLMNWRKTWRRRQQLWTVTNCS